MIFQRYIWAISITWLLWKPFSAKPVYSFSVSISSAQTQFREQSLADGLSRQGFEQLENNQLGEALRSFQEALSLYQTGANRRAESTMLSMIAIVYLKQGSYSEVIRFSELALPLAQEAQDTALQIQILGNLGIAHKALGQYIETVDVYEQALETVRTLPEEYRYQEAQVLELLGNAYSALGDYQQAIDILEESLSIAQETNEIATEVSVLGNIGAVYAKLDQVSLALENDQRSLQLARTIDDSESIAYALSRLGSIYRAQDDFLQALDNYRQSLAIAQSMMLLSLENSVLNNLGLLYEDIGNYEQAIAYYEESLTKAQAIQDPQAAAIALNNLGHALFNSGRLSEAESHLQAAIQALESLRFGLTDNYNITLFDTQIFTYSLLQQILVAQGKNKAALEIAERGRAQAFIDLLAQRANPQRIENISELRRNPLNIEEIKAIAREQNATLVEYALVPDDDFKFQGRQRGQASEIFIWVVKSDGEVVLIHEDLADLLPAGTSLEALVESTRKSIVGNVDGDRNAEQNCHSASDLCLGDIVRRDDVPNEQYEYEIINIDSSNEEFTLKHPDFSYQPIVPISQVSKVENPEIRQNQLKELHQVLIAPIEERNLLPENPEERVIFVPQEQLFLVPFPALQDPSGDYLIQNHTISTIPSIQVLETTRQRRLEIADEGGDALIIGNPSPMPTLPTESEALSELKNSEEEANKIAELLNTTALVNTAATETAVRQRLSSARLIHLATHGLFQEEGDPLQSSIALAPNTENPDGFLTAEEILDYSLQADLVVLSACDTGRGSITGDGVIGLSRSFIAAGTPSVIVSLWQVPDQSTSQLMVKFYENRQTLDKAQSLRQAMLHMIKQDLEPKDWAAFTLIGEAE